MRRAFNRLLSYGLIAAGGLLLFVGARDYVASQLGQKEAAQQFEDAAPPVEAPQTPPAEPAEPYQAPQIGETLAKLSIPRLETELYVVEGDGAKELRRGPGHLEGTALPGQKGNCVIAGHRDTHFRILKDIKPGDDIVLQTRSGEYLYRVKSMEVVSPHNTESLKPTTDSELHLVTCFPFYYVGSAPKRFVVLARLAGAIGGGPS